MENDRAKLRAFMEGLEMQNIDALLEQADAATLRKLGQAMANRIKRRLPATDMTGHIIENETKT